MRSKWQHKGNTLISQKQKTAHGHSSGRSLTTMVVLFVLVATIVTSPQTSADPSWDDPPTGTAEGSGLQECIATAKQERPEAWVCMGGVLTSTHTDDSGQTTTTTRLVEFDVLQTTVPSQVNGQSGTAQSSGDFYDTWCENASVCGRQISSYIAEVKGNGAYGNLRGAIGGFDYIVRQNFNGQYPRWRSIIDWDWGPTVYPNEFYTQCKRHVRRAPDPSCGTETAYFLHINSRNPRRWWPSPTGYDYLSQRLTSSSKYHDDLWGSFRAEGYNTTWHVATIHTGRWRHCDSHLGCRYYQVPWTSNP